MSSNMHFQINSNTIKQAANFIIYLESLGEIKQPYINYNIDKEMNFIWEDNDFILDLGFTGDDHYFYFCRLSNGKKFVEDKVKLESNLPNEIVEELKK